jgi:hypothetical protein
VSFDEAQVSLMQRYSERIANFLAVPLAVEKVTLFGALLCLDNFLYNFTILPIRAIFASIRILRALIHHQRFLPLPSTHLQSLIRILLLIIPTIVLILATDASKMYHTVRGQDTIKLYVIFNALEVSSDTLMACTQNHGRAGVDVCRLLIDYVARSARTFSTRYFLVNRSPRRRRNSDKAADGSRLGHTSSSLCRWPMSVSTWRSISFMLILISHSRAQLNLLLHAGLAQRCDQLLRLHAVVAAYQ